jgi:hypothetical protein
MPNGPTQENIETRTIYNSKSQVNPAGQDDLTLSYTNSEPPREQMPDEHAQRGVQDVEAVALTWSKGYLIAVFVKYVSITWRNSVMNFRTGPDNTNLIVFGAYTSSMHSKQQ